MEDLSREIRQLQSASHSTAVTVAVIQERQKTQGDQLDRIEAHMRVLAEEKKTQNGRIEQGERRLTVLETRAEDARSAGGKAGGIVSLVVSAIVAGLAQAFSRGSQ